MKRLLLAVALAVVVGVACASEALPSTSSQPPAPLPATSAVTAPTPAAEPSPFIPTASPTSQAELSAPARPQTPSGATQVQPGIEVLVTEQSQLVAGKRIGLITNQTGVSAELRSDHELLNSVPGAKVVAFFAGEHGLRGAEEAGKKLDGSIDRYTGAPVYSLYGDTLAPKPEWLRGLDVLLFDIQNTGSAIYTYKFTMSFAMQAAAKAGIPFIVPDRPNPAGGSVVEGPMFPAHDIWRHPLPARHGMTNGELAAMWNEEYRMGAQLTVVKMKGWRRDMTWDETGLPWVMPSPNIPTADTALAYTGQGLIEDLRGISEGRGTTRPFLLTGAPGVDAVAAADELNARRLPGALFRPAYFQPSKPREKFDGQMAGGVELYFTDRRAYRSVSTALNVVDVYRRFSSPRIAVPPGSSLAVPANSTIEQRIAGYQQELAPFLATRAKYLLY